MKNNLLSRLKHLKEAYEKFKTVDENIRAGLILLTIGIIGQTFGPLFVHSYFKYKDRKEVAEILTKVTRVRELESGIDNLEDGLEMLFDNNKDGVLDPNEMSGYAKVNPNEEGNQEYEQFEIEVYDINANKLKNQLPMFNIESNDPKKVYYKSLSPKDIYEYCYKNLVIEDAARQVGNKVYFSNNKAEEILGRK